MQNAWECKKHVQKRENSMTQTTRTSNSRRCELKTYCASGDIEESNGTGIRAGGLSVTEKG